MLIKGSEKFKKIEKLIELTSLKSGELKQSLIGYYCIGVTNCKINKSNFRRAVIRLEKVNEIVNQIEELDNE